MLRILAAASRSTGAARTIFSSPAGCGNDSSCGGCGKDSRSTIDGMCRNSVHQSSEESFAVKWICVGPPLHKAPKFLYTRPRVAFVSQPRLWGADGKSFCSVLSRLRPHELRHHARCCMNRIIGKKKLRIEGRALNPTPPPLS